MTIKQNANSVFPRGNIQDATGCVKALYMSFVQTLIWLLYFIDIEAPEVNSGQAIWAIF